MLVGNTLIHIVVRYCFVADPWQRIEMLLVANAVMTVALAIDLCQLEWWSRRGIAPPRTALRLVLGWIITMTLGAIVAML